MGFTYSFNGHDWCRGVFDTKKEIIEEVARILKENVKSNAKKHYDKFFLAVAKEKSETLEIDIELALENALSGLDLPESVIDNFSPNDEHLKLLEEKINRVVAEWQEETANTLDYYTVHNIKKEDLLTD